MSWFYLKGCGKCGGDLALDEGDWLCLQCGTYFYTGLYQKPQAAEWPPQWNRHRNRTMSPGPPPAERRETRPSPARSGRGHPEPTRGVLPGFIFTPEAVVW
jgi:hypothetical protein